MSFRRAAPGVADSQGATKDAHLTKLERWKLDQEHRAENYKAPELPYLAWVPCEGVGSSLGLL